MEGGPKRSSFEEANALIVVRSVPPIMIERIFSQTKTLNGHAIVDFVKCLCKVCNT